MFYDVFGTPFCKPAFSPLAQRKVDILKSKKRVPKVLRFTMFAELFSAKSSKRGAPNIMIYNVFGTPFWKVEMLTWCNGIPSFSKVKNGVSELWRIKAQIGLRGVKSPKNGASRSLIAQRMERDFRKSFFSLGHSVSSTFQK